MQLKVKNKRKPAKEEKEKRYTHIGIWGTIGLQFS
jgi:hypothetical protein